MVGEILMILIATIVAAGVLIAVDSRSRRLVSEAESAYKNLRSEGNDGAISECADSFAQAYDALRDLELSVAPDVDLTELRLKFSDRAKDDGVLDARVRLFDWIGSKLESAKTALGVRADDENLADEIRSSIRAGADELAIRNANYDHEMSELKKRCSVLEGMISNWSSSFRRARDSIWTREQVCDDASISLTMAEIANSIKRLANGMLNLDTTLSGWKNLSKMADLTCDRLKKCRVPDRVK